MVVTGDLVNNGSAQQLAHAASALVDPPVTVHAGFGDHDADHDSLLTRTFESLIGPSYYSFDRGPYHFVIHNDVRSASLDGQYKQLTWLANDIAAVPPDRPIFVFTHFQPDRREIDLYKNLGVDAVFSGHWHGNRTQGMEGIVSFNSGTMRMGGIDRSSRGFRVVELGGGGGSVTSEVRTGGIAPRIVVVDPPAGGAGRIGQDPGDGLCHQQPRCRRHFTVTGPGGVASGDLTPEGGWCYGGVWEATGLGQADYELTVELTDASGVLASESHTVTLENVVQPSIILGSPWPCFRGDVLGSGRLLTDLTPPLSLAWSRSVGGATESGRGDERRRAPGRGRLRGRELRRLPRQSRRSARRERGGERRALRDPALVMGDAARSGPHRGTDRANGRAHRPTRSPRVRTASRPVNSSSTSRTTAAACRAITPMPTS